MRIKQEGIGSHWSDSEYILSISPKEFAYWSHMEYEQRSWFKDNVKFVSFSNQKDKISIQCNGEGCTSFGGRWGRSYIDAHTPYLERKRLRTNKEFLGHFKFKNYGRRGEMSREHWKGVTGKVERKPKSEDPGNQVKKAYLRGSAQLFQTLL